MREPRCVGRTTMVPRFFCVRIFHLAAQSWAATDFTKMSVPTDVVIPGKVNPIPCTGLASDALPKVHQAVTLPVSAQNGVSTKNALSARVLDEDRLTINEQKEQNPPTTTPSPLTSHRSPLVCPPHHLWSRATGIRLYHRSWWHCLLAHHGADKGG